MSQPKPRPDGDWKLPPKKRNWRPGQYQLGFFVRDPQGGTITIIVDDALKEQATQAVELFVANPKKDRPLHCTTCGELYEMPIPLKSRAQFCSNGFHCCRECTWVDGSRTEYCELHKDEKS